MTHHFSEVEILQADRYSGYGVVVSFSDGTISRYFVEELMALHPRREAGHSSTETLHRFASLLSRAKEQLNEPAASRLLRRLPAK